MTRDQIVITPHRGIEQGLGERLRTTARLSWVWARRDLRARYRQSTMRWTWSLLQPLMILVTYGWVMNKVLDVSGDEAPYLSMAWTGIVIITFFSQSLGQGVGSIQQAGPIVSRVYFPREVLPLSVIGIALFDMAIMSITLVAVVWAQVGAPTLHVIALLPTVLMLIVWTVAITVVAAALTAFRRDLNFAVPLALRVLFIVTPVMYPAALVTQRSRWFVDLNPIAVAVEASRDCLYRSRWPDLSVISTHLGIGLGLLVVAYLVFRRLEPRMADFA